MIVKKTHQHREFLGMIFSRNFALLILKLIKIVISY